MHNFFAQLPREIRLHILSFLDDSEFFKIAPYICKEWKELIKALLTDSILYLKKVKNLKLLSPKQYNKFLEDIAGRDDLQACVALYELALQKLKETPECEWFNIKHEETLRYTDRAIKKDIFLGTLIKILVSTQLIGRLGWVPANHEEKELQNKIYNFVYKGLISSLIIHADLYKKVDLSKYNLLPNFIDYEHNDSIQLLDDGTYLREIKNAKITYIEQSNFSHNEIAAIEENAQSFLNSLDSTAKLIR